MRIDKEFMRRIVLNRGDVIVIQRNPTPEEIKKDLADADETLNKYFTNIVYKKPKNTPLKSPHPPVIRKKKTS